MFQIVCLIQFRFPVRSLPHADLLPWVLIPKMLHCKQTLPSCALQHPGDKVPFRELWSCAFLHAYLLNYKKKRGFHFKMSIKVLLRVVRKVSGTSQITATKKKKDTVSISFTDIKFIWNFNTKQCQQLPKTPWPQRAYSVLGNIPTSASWSPLIRKYFHNIHHYIKVCR